MIRCFLFVFVFVIFCSSSFAQPGRPKPEGWQFSAGAALLSAPLYEGDNEQGLALVPDLRVRYDDWFYFSIPEGLGVRFRPTEWLEVSPLIKLRFSRNETDGPSPFQISGETTDLEGLGDVESAYEAGGYLQLRLRPITFKVEYRQGNGGHEGQMANASLGYGSNIAFVRYQLSATAEWASKEYFNAYYGVDADQSLASGLGQYEVEDSGLNSVGGSLFLFVPIFYPMTIATIFSYRKLQDRSADSTLVSERGSSDQFFAILSLSWAL